MRSVTAAEPGLGEEVLPRRGRPGRWDGRPPELSRTWAENSTPSISLPELRVTGATDLAEPAGREWPCHPSRPALQWIWPCCATRKASVPPGVPPALRLQRNGCALLCHPCHPFYWRDKGKEGGGWYRGGQGPVPGGTKGVCMARVAQIPRSLSPSGVSGWHGGWHTGGTGGTTAPDRSARLGLRVARVKKKGPRALLFNLQEARNPVIAFRLATACACRPSPTAPSVHGPG